MSDRAKFMLGIAAKYIREYYADGIIFYDDAECDGSCVADDCDSAADEIHATLSDLQEQNKALAGHLRAALDWIDTVPSDCALPTMPGFDRDEADATLACL